MIHALSSGAAAYCTKDVQPENLVNIVRHVAEGNYVINDQLLDASEVDEWLSAKSEKLAGIYSDLGDPYQPLSAREMEVLIYVTQGMSNKEIAHTLGISHQTVKNHVTSILRKLGVEDRTQAAIYALRRGWVRLHEPEVQDEE
jgi:DNA-binding NarL/FixJ family response regulator